ncbi:MAG: ammonia-forming cytochrome c nitrite reductase subunit c552, partial [Methanosarcinales archaeon]
DYVGAEKCKECHEDIYTKWQNTKHSMAYENLMKSGERIEEKCLECHSLRTETQVLEGVQCELCHAPGKKHIASDDKKKTQYVNWSVEVCAKCHNSDFHNQVEEWRDSAHSKSLTAAGGSVLENEQCQKCHVAQIIVSKNFGLIEIPKKVENPQPITCPVCHDPHGSYNTHQLRKSKEDLCASCHNPRNIEPGMELRHVQSSMYRDSTLDRAGVRCSDCHMYTEKTGIKTLPTRPSHAFAANPPSTITVDYSIQEEITKKISEVESLLKEAQSIVASGGAEKEKYDKAKYNVDFVKADGSKGIHNPEKAEQMLEEAESLAKELINLTSSKTPSKTPGKTPISTPGFEAIVAIVIFIVITIRFKKG